MIIRVFRATVHPGKEQEFTDFFHSTGYQKVTEHAGCKELRIGLYAAPVIDLQRRES